MPEPQPPERNPIVRALAGWQPARVLMTANRLDVFNVIGQEALGALEIARRCDAHRRSMRLLLDACVALGFLELREGRYAEHCRRPADARQGRRRIHRRRHQPFRRALESMGASHGVGEDEQRRARDRGPCRPEDRVSRLHPGDARPGDAERRRILADNLDLRGRRQLFDAGGGPGTYSVFLVKKNPELRAVVFDLPPAIEIAKELIAEAGVADRITTRAGNYFVDDFGQGNDVVLLSAIVHSMAPRRAKLLLRKALDSLVSGGIVVVHETLVDDSGVAPVGAVLFSLNMLVNTGEGRSYSGREIMSWLRDTGFASPRVQDLPSRRVRRSSSAQSRSRSSSTNCANERPLCRIDMRTSQGAFAMHEMTIAHEIAETVTRAAEKANAKSVVSVELEVGDLAFLDPDNIEMWVRQALDGKLAEDATIKIDVVASTLTCR